MNPPKTNHATTSFEIKVGKTTFHVTNIYKNEIDLAKTIEDLIIKKVLATNEATKL